MNRVEFLPNVQRAVIPGEKVRGYLLCLEHPVGGGKARFFIRAGFRPDRWDEPAEAMKRHARENLVVGTFDDVAGRRFLVEGPCARHRVGNPMCARSGW